MMYFLFSVLYVLCAPNVYASSGGLSDASAASYGCNADYSGFGCPTYNWSKNTFANLNTRMDCLQLLTNASGTFNITLKPVMYWAGATQDGNMKFTIRSGNGKPADDPTTYTPNSKIMVYIKQISYGAPFRGLLLYAVSNVTENNTKLGAWSSTSPDFTNASLCRGAMMHSNAREKAYLSTFTFWTPPAGTGAIVIRLLLKTGPPSPTYTGDFWGGFYLPLQEAAPVAPVWTTLSLNQSCADMCASSNLTCATGWLNSVTGSNILQTLGNTKVLCNDIGVSFCNESVSPRIVGSLCMARAPTCASMVLDPCLQKITDNTSKTKLLCRCLAKDQADATCRSAPPPVDPRLLSPASGQLSQAHRLIWAVPAVLIGQQGRFWTSLLVLSVALIPSVSSHNWLEGTRGRAFGASPVFPQYPQLDPNVVHVQVAQNDYFNLAWAPAHFGQNYVVVYHDDNASQSVLHKDGALEEYLRDGPANQKTLPQTDKMYMRYRRVFDRNYNITVRGARMTEGMVPFSSLIDGMETDPAVYARFGPRPDFLFPTNYPKFNETNYGLLRYTSKVNQNDTYAEYYNPKYPWIEAVWKYYNVGDGDSEDAIAMTIPARNGPGRYQVQWLWRGFYDNIDVDVQPTGTIVPSKYGRPGADAMYAKVHHCVYENPKEVGNCIQVVHNTSQCADYCDNVPKCIGYQLLPLQNPSNFFPLDGPLPTSLAACNNDNFQRDAVLGQDPSAMVCYAILQPRFDTTFTSPPFTLYNDPNNIGFYGTCYHKTTSRVFDLPLMGGKLPVPTPKENRFLNKCVPCKYLTEMDFETPRWQLNDTCQFCGVVKSTPKITSYEATLAEFKVLPTVQAGFFRCDANRTGDLSPDELNLTKISTVIVQTTEVNVANLSSSNTVTKVISVSDRVTTVITTTTVLSVSAGNITRKVTTTNTTSTAASCYKWLQPMGSAVANDAECLTLARRDPACSSHVAFAKDRVAKYYDWIKTLNLGAVPSNQNNSKIVDYAHLGNSAQNSSFHSCACSTGTDSPILATGSTVLGFNVFKLTKAIPSPASSDSADEYICS